MDKRFSAILFRDLYFLYSFYLETVIAGRWYHGVRFFYIAGDLFAAVYCLINAFVNATNVHPFKQLSDHSLSLARAAVP
jgi:hypothetical protein